MDINDLLKMITSIDQKKGKCRGNLRLKVLLKTTHEYARRSWMDGKSGNPQKLQILLKNSIVDKAPATDIEMVDDEEPSIVQVGSVEKSSSIQTTSVEEIVHSNTTSTPKENRHNLSEAPSNTECKTYKWKTKLNSRKVLESIIKNSNYVTEIENSKSGRKIYRVKKNGTKKKVLKSILAHLERNNENSDSEEQQVNRALLKRVRKVLKQCKYKNKKMKIEFVRKARKRPISEVEDDCEELLNLDGFFNKLKALKFSDDA